MKNLNLKHQSSLWMDVFTPSFPFVWMLCIPMSALLLLSPPALANGYPEVPRPIEQAVGNEADYLDEAYDCSFSALSVGPLSRAKTRGNRHLGKALREIGRVDLTGTAWTGAAWVSSGMPSGKLDMATLEEPLGGQFDSNPEVPVALKHRHPVRR